MVAMTGPDFGVRELRYAIILQLAFENWAHENCEYNISEADAMVMCPGEIFKRFRDAARDCPDATALNFRFVRDFITRPRVAS